MPAPRLLRYNAATTLDGFIASPDGTTDWIVPDAAIDFAALYARFSVFVMGRRTYEAVASQTPNPLDGRRVVVVSRTMAPADHPGLSVVSSDAVEHIRRLKSRTTEEEEGCVVRGGGAFDGDGDIWLMGGGGLVAACLDAGLVDTIEAAVMPVVIRHGIGMVSGSDSGGTLAKPYRLELEAVERLPASGILMTRYTVRYDSTR
jgi:dihydrofolate reductase